MVNVDGEKSKYKWHIHVFLEFYFLLSTTALMKLRQYFFNLIQDIFL